MTKRNLETRKLVKDNGFHLYEVAEHIGIAEATISRWLREAPTSEHVVRIVAAVEEMKGEKAR